MTKRVVKTPLVRRRREGDGRAGGSGMLGGRDEVERSRLNEWARTGGMSDEANGRGRSVRVGKD